MLDKHLGHPFCWEFWTSIWPGGIHLARNQIVRVAMFLHHAVPQGGIHLVGTRLQGLPCFYVMQGHLYWYLRKSLRHSMLEKHLGNPFCWEFGTSIWPRGIHLARKQIVRVAIFLHHATSPLPAVKARLQTCNVGQVFGASI